MVNKTSKAQVRLYHISDAKMLESMRSIKKAFSDNKPKFVEYDANFDDSFEDDFAAKLQKAESVKSDDTVKASQKGVTAGVQSNMIKCYDHVMYTQRFVKKAFPDNQAVSDEFGYNKIASLREKQAEMILFMKDFSATSIKYQAELTAKKYPAAKIELSNTLYNDLLNSNSIQEDTIDGRSIATEERIQIYNDLFTIGSDVMNAGKKIFKDDPAMKKLFTLGGKSGNGSTDTPADNPPTPPAQ